MKTYYEESSKTKLVRRMPVIIRLDGRAFHTFTKGMKRPFDSVFGLTMHETMRDLCEGVQGCVLGYTQSDEITLVLVDYQNLETSAWFDYEVQKIVSIAASMATLSFNSHFAFNIAEYLDSDEDFKKYSEKINKAMFDARAFNIPKEEVTNCVFWRQKDAERNSVLSVAQSVMSQKRMNGKKVKDLLPILKDEFGIDWQNDIPPQYQRGSCCVRGEDGKWTIDLNIPVFVGEGRRYIESRINFPDPQPE